MESWASTREDANERQVLPSLFEKYIEATRTIVRKGFKEVTPLRVLNKVRWRMSNYAEWEMVPQGIPKFDNRGGASNGWFIHDLK